ncbi:MAG: SLATT domain-containing protein [Colwellia sp.]
MKSQLEGLYRRTGLTKESCFQASRRLARHNSLSLWSLTTLAFSLIVLSLLTQLYSDNTYLVEYSRVLGFAMTATSIFSMVIAVIVQKSDFSLKADSFRRQAMEINELRISFKHLIEKETTNDQERELLYEVKSNEYSSILSRNLIHAQIDFHVTNSKSFEYAYYATKMFITEFFGYMLTISLSICLLLWAGVNTYLASF